MSYTILTIPFNLKEKAKGEFLNKGFVFDEVFSDYFESQCQGNPFLHQFNFDPKVINKIAANLFIDLNFPNSNLSEQIIEPLFKESSFFDKKHLKSTKSYIRIIVDKEVNNKKVLISSNKPGIKIPNDLISNNFKFCYSKEDQYATFTIDAVKLYINKSKLTEHSIGFGFLQIVLKWDFESAKSMIDGLEPLSELFRYYKGGDDKKNKFELNWNDVINDKVQYIEKRIQDGKLPTEGIDSSKRKIEEYNKWIINGSTQKIDFKLLSDKLLEQICPNVSEMFDFENEEIIKPYVLHLSSYLQNNESGNLDFKSSEVIKQVYRMLRISGSENTLINSYSNLEFTFPDYYTSQFVLNEGAFVIEGVKNPSDLINKYYPSFLFALNQKYLFHYIQEKINELPLIKKENVIEYNAKDLKRLQQTMINAEFSQIFTSLSNYNEIDMFFEKLREQFKIKELKEEYLASIEGISRITQLNEDEKKEEREKLNVSRLNLILLLLTIAQVWPNLYEHFLEPRLISKILFNAIFYMSLASAGIYFYYIHLPIKSNNKKITWPNIMEILNETFTSKNKSDDQPRPSQTLQK